MTVVTVTAQKGVHIHDAAQDAITVARTLGRPVVFVFKDAELTVMPEDTPEAVERRYWNQHR